MQFPSCIPEIDLLMLGLCKASNSTPFYIVGIGASAGGLAAFEAFFLGFPQDSKPEMAFVVVQHLAPDYQSILVELIGRYTHFPVFEAKDGLTICPNFVYVNPPGHDLSFLNGVLQLSSEVKPRGQHLPIDSFFQSLAHDQHQYAIAIILSGMGSDGTKGLRAIKDQGGMVMSQLPASTEFQSMPTNAIATGFVDYVSIPSEMPAYLKHHSEVASKKPHLFSASILLSRERNMARVFGLIRSRTGHDFSKYKFSTIERRVERRMAVQQIQALGEYLDLLEHAPLEVDALFRDLLIGVTRFFRDPEAFKALEEHGLPRLIAEKPDRSGLMRAWIGGCSTGEEAYSIAILLQEQLNNAKAGMSLQVFATDIDARAIATARAGCYEKSIAEDMSADRFARCFASERNLDVVRIEKGIREMLVFSEHDINRDPPFSKLDLIACRNVMIYLDAGLQRRLIPLFHFALNPGGLLLLGSSEGIGDFEDLFEPIDRKAKLFRRRPNSAMTSSLRGYSPMQSSTTRIGMSQRNSLTSNLFKTIERPPMVQFVERCILEHFAKSAVLVDAQGDILYLHGRTGAFLELVPGEPSINNVLRMSREGLRFELTKALRRVVANGQSSRVSGLEVHSDGYFTKTNLNVIPVEQAKSPTVETSGRPLYLVVFEEVLIDLENQFPIDLPSTTERLKSASEVESLVASLREDLQSKEEYLESAHEELESSNEELMSSNEEMQSINEELQSTNEELETSKEELQSINEELATVNTELQNKVTELSRLNNDMYNLLMGSGIATVFLDRQMRIIRFTPSVAQIINLIPSDYGRPLGHIVSNLVGNGMLVPDAQKVLDSLISVESQVQTTAGLWFSMRIQPYRTLSDVVEGVEITFIDISDAKRIEASLAMANNQLRLAVVVRDASDAITVHDLHGQIIAWNPSAERIYGWSEEEALQLNVSQRIPELRRKECLVMAARLCQAEVIEPYKTQRVTKAGHTLNVWVTATSLINEGGCVYAIATTERPEGRKHGK